MFDEQAKNILNRLNLKYSFLEYLTYGGEAEVYTFKVKNKTFILKILDLERTIPYSPTIQKYLLKLSKLKLIPKIYFIGKNYLITDFIYGKTLRNLEKNLSVFQFNQILIKLRLIIDKWHKLGLGHGDLNSDNIIIDEDFNFYLIDPNIDPIIDNIEDDEVRFKLLEYKLLEL